MSKVTLSVPELRYIPLSSTSASDPVISTVTGISADVPGRTINVMSSRSPASTLKKTGGSAPLTSRILELFESIAFDFIDEFPSAFGHDTPVLQNMDDIRLDIFQKFLIMSDDDG